MTDEEIYAIKPDEDGWRVLPNGYKVKIGDSVSIGNGANIGDGAEIGNYASIGKSAEIGSYASIGKSADLGSYVSIGNGANIGDGAEIGNDAKIGNYASIGNGAEIGDNLEILSGFASLSLTDKWVVNPYSVGQIRCGCFIGSYKDILGRSNAEWMSHEYTTEQIDLVKNFVRFCQTNEHLMLKEKNNHVRDH